MPRLPKFEGREVRSASVAITGAGDGLSKELRIQPEALRIGQEVFYVLKGTVAHVDHKPIEKDGKDLDRKHTVRTDEITRVDADAVEEFLAAARARIAEADEAERIAEEEAQGIQRLPTGEDE